MNEITVLLFFTILYFFFIKPYIDDLKNVRILRTCLKNNVYYVDNDSELKGKDLIKRILNDDKWEDKISRKELKQLSDSYKRLQKALSEGKTSTKELLKNDKEVLNEEQENPTHEFIESEFFTGENRMKEDECITRLLAPYRKKGIIYLEDCWRLQKDNPALFITYNIYSPFHLWVCPQYDFYIKMQKFIKRIENQTGQYFKLMPVDNDFILEDDNFKEPLININELHEFLKSFDFNDITEIIECKKTGKNKKNEYYYDSKGNECSTENVVIDHLKNKGYEVIYAENNFWKPLTVLAYFDEIYSQCWTGQTSTPYNIGTSFPYRDNQELFDKKTEFLKSCNLTKYIQEQIKYFGFLDYNVFRCMGTDYIEYIENNGIFFLNRITNELFLKIVNRIIKCPAEYGRGLPDLLAYKDGFIYFVEVKRLREKMRPAQENWIAYLKKNKIPVKIIRVKGV